MKSAQDEIKNTVTVNTSDTDQRPLRDEDKKKKGQSESPESVYVANSTQ